MLYGLFWERRRRFIFYIFLAKTRFIVSWNAARAKNFRNAGGKKTIPVVSGYVICSTTTSKNPTPRGNLDVLKRLFRMRVFHSKSCSLLTLLTQFCRPLTRIVCLSENQLDFQYIVSTEGNYLLTITRYETPFLIWNLRRFGYSLTKPSKLDFLS